MLAALRKFPGIRPDPEAFIEALDPAPAPRLFHFLIAPLQSGTRSSLTVDAVRYEIDRRTRLGVCSTFLGGRVASGDKIKDGCAEGAALRAAGGSLETDHHDRTRHRHCAVPCVSPGATINAPGHNWLFFGHQRSDYDFFYEEELVAMRASGLPTRLTLAWS